MGRTLQDIGHTQPLTPLHTDNTTPTDIIHKTIKTAILRNEYALLWDNK